MRRTLRRRSRSLSSCLDNHARLAELRHDLFGEQGHRAHDLIVLEMAKGHAGDEILYIMLLL